MTEKEFATQILDATQKHWSYVLNGHRNLGYKKAKIVSVLLKTDIEVWLDRTRTVERQAKWEKFNSK